MSAIERPNGCQKVALIHSGPIQSLLALIRGTQGISARVTLSSESGPRVTTSGATCCRCRNKERVDETYLAAARCSARAGRSGFDRTSRAASPALGAIKAVDATAGQVQQVH